MKAIPDVVLGPTGVRLMHNDLPDGTQLSRIQITAKGDNRSVSGPLSSLDLIQAAEWCVKAAGMHGRDRLPVGLCQRLVRKLSSLIPVKDKDGTGT